MNQNILEMLNFIDPSALDYTAWCNVGMALKEEGCSVGDWDAWSARDVQRYHPGECERKWNTFHGNAAPVTGGTIWQMAYESGWRPDPGEALDWNGTITKDDAAIIDPTWVEKKDIRMPGKSWNPVNELITYLETLFEADDNVGYVVQSYKNDKGRFVPRNKGSFKRTAGELIEDLAKHTDDIGAVLGDYDPEGGAWIRFNPLDGKGVRNDNVTSYKYALVESDNMDIAEQNALIRELELPVACLVHSGGKSLHAIVKIDAPDYKEYRARVDFLYNICRKNGLSIDTQNKNPARLSRMPGIMRNGNKQFLAGTNIGKSSWEEWKEWIESETDDLPEMDALSDVWDNIPPLAPELICGILRNGHKMLISGPSKAGKSFLLIELAIAIAEGSAWIGHKCKKGSVLYVNLELDRASCLNRFRDVYTAKNMKPQNIKNIEIWNLRGRSVPMDKLAPILIRRAKKKDFQLIIIDPIYKVITGDENSADQMARFCNQFDKICNDLGCAVAYCHHHSKGLQGQKKAMDRASGSGVFARDPDAMLDIIELPLTEAIIDQEKNKAVCRYVRYFLEEKTISNWDWKNAISEDDWLNSRALLDVAHNGMGDTVDFWDMKAKAKRAADMAAGRTAWRVDAILREFARPEPVNMWFDYPAHSIDDSGVLGDINPESDRVDPAELKRRRMEEAKKKQEGKINDFEVAFESLEEDGKVSMAELAEQLEVSVKTLGLWLGKGKRGNAKLKKRYEKFLPEGNGTVTYIRRKNE